MLRIFVLLAMKPANINSEIMTTLKSKTKKVLLNKDGSVSKNVTNALYHCFFSGNKIYTGYYSGSGRFTTRQSAGGVVASLLTAQGYKYTDGNDSPRGGANGEFIKVSKTALNFIASLV